MEVIQKNEISRKLDSRDQRKLEVFQKKIQKPLLNLNLSHSWSYLGLPICLYFHEDSSPQEFCKNYFEPFNSPLETTEALDIVFLKAPEPYNKANDPIWWTPEPHTWFCDHSLSRESGSIIIQRDFIAWVNAAFNKVYVMTPDLSNATTDSLDNLMAILFSFRGLEVGAIPIHSAMVKRDGKAYVFFGDSGAGKSTLAAQCFHKEELEVMATDQGFLKYADGVLWAQASTRKNPELPRIHPRFNTNPVAVGGLIHLVQKDGFYKRTLMPSEFLKEFVRQTIIYRTPFDDQAQYLELCLKMLSSVNFKQQLSYPKDAFFWEFLFNSQERPMNV